MSRRKAPVTQSDIARAVRGVLAGGVTVEQIAGVKITPEGVVILLGERAPVQTAGPKNEWDEVLQ